ncbi:DUF4401 domain-containing protein [Fibrobacter sp. UWB11]|uniref:DUF4401 domain-containing protein n=1 Tax=Fibrobacter sp. UWB11 TaxID=1896202 RepID=UPI00092B2C22|nr:DUF4401 domain-containing protein [Fibrobacter sp. UWB11]SIO28421.1 protein of unknown function [Fibrobacter sp. UWB11]
MENNSRKSKQLPAPLMIVMAFGGIIIAALTVGFVALIARDNKIVYAVLSVISIIGAIMLSRDGKLDDDEVPLLLVTYPLFFSGFTYGYIAGFEYLTLTYVLQFVAAVLSFAFSKIRMCRQMLLCYALVVLPLIFFSYFDGLSTLYSHYSKIPPAIEISCFAIIVAYMGAFAATIKYKWFASTVLKDYLNTIRIAAALISVALLKFIQCDNTVFAVVFAVISFAIAFTLLRKYVTGKRLIESSALALLCCASTAMYPAMALPIVGMLLSFLILDYACLVIFSVAFVCGIAKFYYDLDMLLINKSYLLLASGALFLLMFYFIKRVSK